jgi:UDP-GlcNAc:undecaprenyl-phosphate GlcNAc-1-phosphate transferase
VTFHAPDYIAAFLVALLVAWGLTPLMLGLAMRSGLLDAPDDERKAQTSAVPFLGGVAIVLAFSAAVLSAAVISRPPSGVRELAILLGLALLLSVMGLIDDLRGLGALVRLLVEIGAACVVFAIGSGVQIGPRSVSLAITVLWIVGITNAINLLDNMDGLSAGVATIASLGFFAIAVLNHQFLVAALAAALAGCATGFLRHNFHPARIYMGDAGSLFLGFMLAVLGVRLRLADTPPLVAAFVPVFVLGVALFDTTLVTVNRLRHGRSPLSGGRDHASHRLVAVGIPVPVAVGLLYGLALSLSWLAVVLARLDTATGLLLVAFVMTVGAGTFALLSAVPVYASSRQKATMFRLVREHEFEPLAPASATHRPDALSPAERLAAGE